jgi:hypothetical protein
MCMLILRYYMKFRIRRRYVEVVVQVQGRWFGVEA